MLSASMVTSAPNLLADVAGTPPLAAFFASDAKIDRPAANGGQPGSLDARQLSSL